MEIISTNKAPAAIGPYSQAIIANGFVFVSGQTPLDPETGVIVSGGIKEQTERVALSIEALLVAAGSDVSRVVKTSCFLKTMDDFAEFNEVYASHFTGKPARSTVAAAGLPRGALVEIEAIALV